EQADEPSARQEQDICQWSGDAPARAKWLIARGRNRAVDPKQIPSIGGSPTMVTSSSSDMRPLRWVARAGAILFGVWALLHFAVALAGIAGYLQRGPTGVLAVYGGNASGSGPSGLLDLAGAIGLNYSIDLAAFGALGVWIAVLVWRGQRLGLWMGVVILGIADGAFLVALVLPGRVSLADGLVGPVLYVLAVAVSAVAFLGRSPHMAAGPARQPRREVGEVGS